VLAVALRGLAVHPLRILLTGVSVLLGVALIAGTLVFTDTIHRTYDRIFSDAAQGADVVVSGRGSTTAGRFSEAPSVPQALAPRLARSPAVARVEGQISDTASLLDSRGRVVQVDGSPTIAVSYMHPPFQALRVTRGQAPIGPGQIALDERTARAQHLGIGASVRVATQGPTQAFTIVGLVRFGGAATAGATYLAFDLRTAQRLFLKPGTVDSLSLQGRPGTDPRRLLAQVRPLLTPELQARTGQDQARQGSAHLRRGLSFLIGSLLGFGAIALLVAAFVIFNTYSITVAQRTREYALLRALGASRRQVLGAVLIQALAVGATASALGTAAGYGAAEGLRALISAAGGRLAFGPEVLELRTVGVSVAAGIGVTVVAALVPALRATRLPPVSALREGVVPPATRLGRAMPWLGAGALASGVLVSALALRGGGSIALATGGAALLILALALLSPRLVGPLARAAGWPLERATAVVGRLGRENALRNPARSATTASALMIGLAVMLFVTVFASSARSSIEHLIDRDFTGDVALVNRDGSSPIPVAAATPVRAVPGVDVASVLKRADSRVAGAGSQQANAIDPQTIQNVYRFDWVEGSDTTLGLLGPDGALVEKRFADRANLHVGESFDARGPSGRHERLLVRGIYRDQGLLGGYTVGLPAFNDFFGQRRAAQILVKLTAAADPRRVLPAISRALSAFPDVRARSQRQLATAQAQRVDSVLYLFYALLALSVVVSLFGLVNTLSLSVHERTRELGLMRALGSSRRSLRRAVRYEGVIVAAVGATMGALLGLFLAVVMVSALSSQGLELSIPWSALAGLLALSLLLAVLAAVVPARRASRLDILGAIAYE